MAYGAGLRRGRKPLGRTTSPIPPDETVWQRLPLTVHNIHRRAVYFICCGLLQSQPQITPLLAFQTRRAYHLRGRESRRTVRHRWTYQEVGIQRAAYIPRRGSCRIDFLPSRDRVHESHSTHRLRRAVCGVYRSSSSIAAPRRTWALRWSISIALRGLLLVGGYGALV